MNKNQVKKVVDEIRANRNLLDEIEKIAGEYLNIGKPHNLDNHILFELESLQDKLSGILYRFYLGDIYRDYSEGKITYEERQELIYSRRGKMPAGDRGPYFSFGYTTGDFIDNLEDL